MSTILKSIFNAFHRETVIDGVAIMAIGNEGALCPSCNQDLPKFPMRKIICKSCGKPIYSRTRPLDKKKVLLSDSQAQVVEEQWAAVNGNLSEFRRERERETKARCELEAKFGQAPSENDVRWRILNEDAMKHASNGDIGLYTNTQREMSEILIKEGRYEQALTVVLAVCYLDYCGPQNTSGRGDMERTLFLKEQGFIAPGKAARAAKAIKALKISEADVYTRYLQATEPYRSWHGIPLTPEEAWPEISSAVR